MKTKKLAFAAAAAATLVLGACGNNNDSSGSTESDEIVTELSEDTTVTFWHAMNGAQEESLTKFQTSRSNCKTNPATLIYKQR